jgi:hypothetical protein
MRGRTKVVSFAVMLSIIVVSSIVFSSGLVNVSRSSLFNMAPIEPNQGTPNVFVDPNEIVKDYLNYPAYQIGHVVDVYINVSGATDLFTYQVNVTWSPTVLNFTGVTYGEFLARTSSPHGTSRIEPTFVASNVTGYASIAETILGDYAGITGSGRLLTLHFLVVGYGWTWIDVSLVGSLPTVLLESDGTPVTPSVTKGWFDNRITGDSDGNGVVSLGDIAAVSSRWTTPPGLLPYVRYVDWTGIGVISLGDIAVVSGNWGRHT